MLRKVMLAVATLIPTVGLSDTATCHIIYGGENFTVSAQPTGDPYAVKGEKIGRYFEFKLSYVTTPADLAALSVYVYSIASGESVLLHQAKYAADVVNTPGKWGFTGFNYIYEASKSSEIKYWCEKRPD